MAGATLKQGNGKELRKLFAMLAGSMGETLGSLVSKPIVVRPGEPTLVDVDDWVAALPKAAAVARGALDKGFAGKSFLTVVDVPDAVAMAGLLMMTPDHVIEQRRAAGVLDGEDAEAFGELGNVLYSGLGNVLREQVGNIDVRFQDHGVVKPGLDKDGVLGVRKLAVFPFTLKVVRRSRSRVYTTWIHSPGFTSAKQGDSTANWVITPSASRHKFPRSVGHSRTSGVNGIADRAGTTSSHDPSVSTNRASGT